MALVISDAGLLRAMNILRVQWNADALKLRLFKSDTRPTRETLLTDLVEADFAGYAAVALTSWAAAVLAGHVATSSAAVVTFTKAAGGVSNSIFGYYVTNSAGTELFWSERDDNAPMPMNVTGNQYNVQATSNYQNLVFTAPEGIGNAQAAAVMTGGGSGFVF